MQYKLYQDGEINFTLQDPDNHTLAVFGVHSSDDDNDNEGYFVKLPAIKTSTQRQTVYLGIDKQEAITKAYNIAKDFAKQLDPNFQDLTQLGKLEQTIAPRHTLHLKEVLTRQIPKEDIHHLNDL